jgi:hypothetical protein
LSLLATAIDAVFDIGSNVLLFWLHRKAAKLDVNKWPVGGARLETIGNVVYGKYKPSLSLYYSGSFSRFPVSALVISSTSWSTHYRMGSVNFVVIVESVRGLATGEGHAEFHLAAIITVGAALGMWLQRPTMKYDLTIR